jgi:hypothetical protein
MKRKGTEQQAHTMGSMTLAILDSPDGMVIITGTFFSRCRQSWRDGCTGSSSHEPQTNSGGSPSQE